MAGLFTDANVQFVLRTLLRLGAPVRDAEDLAQEVFMVVHRRAADFDPDRPVVAWLYGITKNVLRDYRKLARNRHELLVDASPDRPGSAPHDDADLLRRSLATLAEEHADAIILCDLSGFSVLETARVLAVPEGTLKDRLRRARDELRAEIHRRREEAARV